ncbi:hypothetical protein HDV05_007728 [Chytridiales sp. JEL 0842]|nr:hypothetical protein HDV05_007728 [Chytridiales sp. JEL 0842]
MFAQPSTSSSSSSATTKVDARQDEPWIEKYRPKSIDQVSSQEESINVLRSALKSQNLPHLLFYGPPGTGKTSTILALSRDIYGYGFLITPFLHAQLTNDDADGRRPENMKSRVLELNASDERGIDVIREKVKNFARTTISQNTTHNGQPVPPYKIIILDEADSMTVDAQSALRRTMETYSKITRFCLICNYVSRIIEPLASRCSKFRFKSLDDTSVKSRLTHIIESEGVNCPEKTLNTLVNISGGDLRRSIMYLQSAFRLYQKEPITEDAIYSIAGTAPDDLVERLFESCKSKDYSQISRAVTVAMRAGFSGTELLNQLHKKLIMDVHLSPRQKALLCQACGAADKALNDGADEHLQILKLLVTEF